MTYDSFEKIVRSGSLFWRVYIGHSIHEDGYEAGKKMDGKGRGGGGGGGLDCFLTAGRSKSTYKNQYKLSC